MKHYILFIFLIAGCAQISPSVDMVELGNDTSLLKDYIEECAYHEYRPSCKDACDMINAKPWLVDWSAMIKNDSGLEGNEWELSKRGIAKDLAYIRKNYLLFRMKSSDYFKKSDIGGWCYKSVDCSGNLQCSEENTCLPSLNRYSL